MGNQRYTVAQVKQALEETKGLVYLAAQRLRCDPSTIHNYLNRHPSLQATLDAQRGALLDTAEAKLWASIQKGESWGISLALKTIGKSRGYVERTEVTGKDGGPQEHAVHLAGARDRLTQRLAHLGIRHAEDPPAATNGHSNGVHHD